MRQCNADELRCETTPEDHCLGESTVVLQTMPGVISSLDRLLLVSHMQFNEVLEPLYTDVTLLVADC